MRIRHEIATPQLDEQKKRITDSRWFPVVIVVTTAIVLRACSKQTINIYINEVEEK